MQALYTQYKQQLTPYYTSHEVSLIFRACVAHVLQINEQNTYFLSDVKATQRQYDTLERMLQLLAAHTPLQYVLGYETFMGLRFMVNADVLIPRPETALLVKQIIEEFKGCQSLSILDVGTGSGCIAITLAHYLPQARVTAIDVSDQALNVAKKNAHSIGVNVQFNKVNFLTDAASLSSQFDVLVSNPPYVKNEEKAEMEKHVLLHEPHLALFVPDNDPLVFYRAIAHYAKQYVTNVYLEINQNLGHETKRLFLQNGFDAYLLKDQFDRFRYIKAINKSLL